MIIFLFYLLGILVVMYGAYSFYQGLVKDADVQERMNKIVDTTKTQERIKGFVADHGFNDKANQIKNFIKGKE